MSVQTEIDRISTAVQNAHLKVIEKGGTSAAPYLVANLADAIDTIPEAEEPTLQSKTVSPSTSAQTVKPDSGYDGLSQVTVNAMTTVTQATPEITVSSAGLITAKSTQTAGYLAAGTKSATKQLTAQAAQTITPGTADKTIASGRYLTGTQTIKGDANLLAGNIKSGVSIFGVAGTMTAGEDVTAETETYTGLLTDLEAAVDALPDAGAGGGVETCTVTVNNPAGKGMLVDYMSVENGAIVRKSADHPDELSNVLRGSILSIINDGSDGFDSMTITCDNCEVVRNAYDYNQENGTVWAYIFAVNTDAATASITFSS